VTTNLRFLRWLVRRPEVVRSDARIDTLDAIWPAASEASDGGTAATGGSAIPETTWAEAARLLGAGGWRLNGPARARLVADEETERWVAAAAGPADPPIAAAHDGASVHLDVGGRSVAFRVASPPDVDRAAKAAASHAVGAGIAEVHSPMPGAVIAVHVAVGDLVDADDPIVTLEAMKMEHAVPSPRAGRVGELLVGVGDQVTRGQILATLDA
jgi:acetyl-CoA/propionyl-CoA carboxylase biotin carboxyl carrier protein